MMVVLSEPYPNLEQKAKKYQDQGNNTAAVSIYFYLIHYSLWQNNTKKTKKYLSIVAKLRPNLAQLFLYFACYEWLQNNQKQSFKYISKFVSHATSSKDGIKKFEKLIQNKLKNYLELKLFFYSELKKYLPQNLAQPYSSMDWYKNNINDSLVSDSKTKLDLIFGFMEMNLIQESKNKIKEIKKTDHFYTEAQLVLAKILFEEADYLKVVEICNALLQKKTSLSMEIEVLYTLIRATYSLMNYEKVMKLIELLHKKCPNYRDIQQIKVDCKKNIKK